MVCKCWRAASSAGCVGRGPRDANSGTPVGKAWTSPRKVGVGIVDLNQETDLGSGGVGGRRGRRSTYSLTVGKQAVVSHGTMRQSAVLSRET
eukprot:4200185-Pyramimonas_sp.AAC.1